MSLSGHFRISPRPNGSACFDPMGLTTHGVTLSPSMNLKGNPSTKAGFSI